MKHRVRFLIAAGIQAGLIVLLVGAAKLLPQIYPAFYTSFSRTVNHALGTAAALLPVPVWELLLAGLVVWQLVSLIVCLTKKCFLSWLCRLPWLLTLLALVFVGVWGLNFFGPGVADAVGLEVETYTQTELQQALGYYAAQASAYSAQVQRDDSGDVVLPDEKTLSDGAVRSVELLARDYPRFSEPAPRVKYLLGSELFGHMGVTGIYVCFTGEPSVSQATHAPSVPFTMCHELGHSLCFCAEDEANFAGFLACAASEDPLFRYSGYLNAFIYCFNALYELNPSAAQQSWALVSDEVIHDCNAARAHYEKYEGTVQEAAQSVNDAYLRSFDQEGTRSYDMVTDHLIAYYLKLSS